MEIFAAIVAQLSLQQSLDNIDRFGEAILPLRDAWPPQANHVLIEAFA
jgi:hypothetical protein